MGTVSFYLLPPPPQLSLFCLSSSCLPLSLIFCGFGPLCLNSHTASLSLISLLHAPLFAFLLPPVSCSFHPSLCASTHGTSTTSPCLLQHFACHPLSFLPCLYLHGVAHITFAGFGLEECLPAAFILVIAFHLLSSSLPPTTKTSSHVGMLPAWQAILCCLSYLLFLTSVSMVSERGRKEEGEGRQWWMAREEEGVRAEEGGGWRRREGAVACLPPTYPKAGMASMGRGVTGRASDD